VTSISNNMMWFQTRPPQYCWGVKILSTWPKCYCL